MTRYAGIVALVLIVLGTAGWGYNINYRTLRVINDVETLRQSIVREREHLQVMRVEWAYLNNPARLQRLLATHGQELGLRPLTPGDLQSIESVPFDARTPDPEAVLFTPSQPIPLPRTTVPPRETAARPEPLE